MKLLVICLHPPLLLMCLLVMAAAQQPQDGCPEETVQFEWAIGNISIRHEEQSRFIKPPEFHTETKWHVCLYPGGSFSDKHVALVLCMNPQYANDEVYISRYSFAIRGYSFDNSGKRPDPESDMLINGIASDKLFVLSQYSDDVVGSDEAVAFDEFDKYTDSSGAMHVYIRVTTVSNASCWKPNGLEEGATNSFTARQYETVCANRYRPETLQIRDVDFTDVCRTEYLDVFELKERLDLGTVRSITTNANFSIARNFRNRRLTGPYGWKLQIERVDGDNLDVELRLTGNTFKGYLYATYVVRCVAAADVDEEQHSELYLDLLSTTRASVFHVPEDTFKKNERSYKNTVPISHLQNVFPLNTAVSIHFELKSFRQTGQCYEYGAGTTMLSHYNRQSHQHHLPTVSNLNVDDIIRYFTEADPAANIGAPSNNKNKLTMLLWSSEKQDSDGEIHKVPDGGLVVALDKEVQSLVGLRQVGRPLQLIADLLVLAKNHSLSSLQHHCEAILIAYMSDGSASESDLYSIGSAAVASNSPILKERVLKFIDRNSWTVDTTRLKNLLEESLQ